MYSIFKTILTCPYSTLNEFLVAEIVPHVLSQPKEIPTQQDSNDASSAEAYVRLQQSGSTEQVTVFLCSIPSLCYFNTIKTQPGNTVLEIKKR